MSDPVTNVEIEDVLSSIRRLVAEGDQPRSPFTYPDVADKKPALQAERFVLTPALRVAEAPSSVRDTVDLAVTPDAESEAVEAAEPLVLEPAAMLEVPKIHDRMSESERASLEATIAELEAAMTYQPDDEWEPDGSEVKPTSGLAAAFAATDAEVVDDQDVAETDGPRHAKEVAPERVVRLRPEKSEPTFRHATAYEADVEDDESTDYGDDLRAGEDDGMPIPDDLDETLAAYIASGTAMDRAEIRRLVVDVVRQELQGELGERISRNIRKLVRREIQRATSANVYD